MQALTIMKPGCFLDMHRATVCFTAEALERVATYYDPYTHEAPLVLGHPADDASSPAHGWVKSLTISHSGELIAMVDKISAEFKALVHAGRYRHISPSFWPPTHPQNPIPGIYTLRHIGALGAATPAVKGLSTFAFADHPCALPGCATFAFAAHPCDLPGCACG